jgi:hypothetical protein
MQGSQHLVADDLATLQLVRLLHPVPAHLPALVHILVNLPEEFLTLPDDLFRHGDRVNLFFNYNFQNHAGSLMLC